MTPDVEFELAAPANLNDVGVGRSDGKARGRRSLILGEAFLLLLQPKAQAFEALGW
jgi:hypothetical protein